MTTVLVTGAGGFLGPAVVRALLARRPRTTVVASIRNRELGDPVSRHRGDLLAAETWAGLPPGIEGVVHLASIVPGPEASGFGENVALARHLADWVRSAPSVRWIVHASSALVYGRAERPLSEERPPLEPDPYGASKLEAERILAGLPVRTISLRLASIYGPGQAPGTVVPVFVDRARRGEPLVLFGDGTRTQDFVHVDDAARGILLAIDSDASGVLNLGSGRATSMFELAERVVEAFGSRSPVVLDPTRPEHGLSVRIAIQRARDRIGYVPRISLEDGLRLYRDALEG